MLPGFDAPMLDSYFLLCLVGLSVTPLFSSDEGGLGDSGDAVMGDLQKAIPYGIALLEKQDYRTFLEEFVQPEQMAKLTSTRTLEEFANNFGAAKARDLLAVLQAIQTLPGRLESDGDLVIYTIPEDIAEARGIEKREMAFIRSNNHWHIHNEARS